MSIELSRLRVLGVVCTLLLTPARGIEAQQSHGLTLGLTSAVNLPGGGWGLAEASRLYGIRAGYGLSSAAVLWGSLETGQVNSWKCSLVDPDCRTDARLVQVLAGGELVLSEPAPASVRLGAGAGSMFNLMHQPEWNVVVFAGVEFGLGGLVRVRNQLQVDRISGLNVLLGIAVRL